MTPPNVFSALATQGFTSTGDNTWNTIPNFALSFSVNNANAVVVLSWNFSTVVGGGFVLTRLVIDDVPVPGTAQALGMLAYGYSSGTYNTILAAGAHTITLQYRTATTFTFNPAIDLENLSLQALSFDSPQ